MRLPLLYFETTESYLIRASLQIAPGIYSVASSLGFFASGSRTLAARISLDPEMGQTTSSHYCSDMSRSLPQGEDDAWQALQDRFARHELEETTPAGHNRRRTSVDGWEIVPIDSVGSYAANRRPLLESSSRTPPRTELSGASRYDISGQELICRTCSL